MLNGKTSGVLTLVCPGLEGIPNQTLTRSNQYRSPCKSITKFDFRFVMLNLKLVEF